MKSLNIVVFSLVLALLVFAESDAVRWQNIASKHSVWPQPTQNQKNQSRADDPNTHEDPRITDWLLVAIGVLQAVIFWKQVGVSDRQSRIADDQRRLMEVQFHIANRPRLKVRNFCLTSSHSDEPSAGRFACQFTLVNVGGTDAKNVECSAWVDWRDGNLPMMRPYDGILPNSKFQKTIMVAGNRDIVQFDETDTLADHWSIKNAPDVIFSALGFVDYFDVFGRQYRTAFCRTYDRTSRSFVAVKNGDYEHEE